MKGRITQFFIVLMVASSELCVQAQVFFSPPQNLTNSPGYSWDEQIAVDSRGNINVVWTDDSSGISQVFFSRSADGGTTFVASKQLSMDSLGSHYPKVALDKLGNVNVVWSDGDHNPQGAILFSRSSDRGVTFSVPEKLSNTAISGYGPQIATSNDGAINVIWSAQVDCSYSWCNAVYFSRSTDRGASFSQPMTVFDIDTLTDLWCNFWGADLGLDSAGDINILMGASMCSGADGIAFVRSTDRGATFSVLQFLAVEDYPLFSAKLTVAPPGNITIAGVFGFVGMMFAQSSDGIKFSYPVLPYTLYIAEAPAVGVHSLRNANVIYSQPGGTWIGGTPIPRGIYYSHNFDAGKKVSDAFGVGNRIVLDAAGSINVISGGDLSSSFGYGDIYFIRSTDSGMSFSSARKLSGDNPSYDQQLAVDIAGNINVLWSGYSTSNGGNADVFFVRGVTLDSLHNDIHALPASAFKNASRQRAMLNKLNDIRQALADGDTSLAVSELKDLLGHLDGCGTSPGTNNWIINCTAQFKIRGSIDVILAALRGQKPLEHRRAAPNTAFMLK